MSGTRPSLRAAASRAASALPARDRAGTGGADPLSGAQIDAVRRFNRFYTREVGALGERLLRSPYSLTEVRVLYELAHAPHATASDLVVKLDLDAGYLSRILARFERAGLIRRQRSTDDARSVRLSLTDKGAKTIAPLERASQNEVAERLGVLSSDERARLLGAMATIETLLGDRESPRVPYVLRPHRPGDIGWVVSRHGGLYASEYGWDVQFEALVAEIAAKFLREFNPKRECCWIAEREGRNVGSAFVVEKSKTVAQLRLLIVEPSARGLGIGHRLVEECIRFARDCGYKTLMLWTNDILHAARRIYQQAGFQLVSQEKHHSFGHDLVGQNWSLKLS